MEANPHGAPKANNIEIAINRFVERIKDSKLKIPVFLAKDKDLGHSKKMRPLMLGCNSKIISNCINGIGCNVSNYATLIF